MSRPEHEVEPEIHCVKLEIIPPIIIVCSLVVAKAEAIVICIGDDDCRPGITINVVQIGDCVEG